MTLASIALALTQAILFLISRGRDVLQVEQPKLNWAELSTTRWWGPDSTKAHPDTKIYNANITFSADMIRDLRARLDHSINAPRPFTKNLDNAAFLYGFNPNQTLTWLKYWRDEYNFKAQEKIWNTFPMFKTNVQGLDIFYIRVSPPKNTKKEVVPMLLLHGFPGSIREFYDVIPLLTAESPDRDWVIDLIVPSLPGYGFSSAATKPGMGAGHVAVVFRNFMRRLGYKKWYVQGGDFGARILAQMVTIFPDEVLGYHANWGVVLSPPAILMQIAGSFFPSAVVPQRTYDRMYPLESVFQILLGGTGYMHLQGTKPDSFGVSTEDSPAALMAYILEKYSTAVSKMNIIRGDGGLFTAYKQSFLIDTLMYYWSTHSFQTAMRLYAETFNKVHAGLGTEETKTNVPTWIVQAYQEISYQSPIILRYKFRNTLNFEVLDFGGHFLAHELPEIFSKSVLTAFTAFREWHKKNGTDTNVYL